MNVSLTLLRRYQYTPQAGSKLKASGVVLLNGNLVYFSGRHLLYALPALVCMLTIGVLPPIILLTYPLFNKVMAFLGLERSKPIKFIPHKLPIYSSLKPLLDSFQGCFKDNLRFFAGLYFLYRWIGLIVSASTSSYSTFFTVVEILLLCVLALHAICQPYIKRAHNIVDTLLLTDLAIVNAISFANYYTNGQKVYKTTSINAAIAIQLVLIYLPMVIMVMYILTVLCKHSLHGSSKHDNVSLSEGSLTSSISSGKVYKLRSFLHSLNGETGSNKEDELPHRLIADIDDIEYRRFEDNDCTSSIPKETSLKPTY